MSFDYDVAIVGGGPIGSTLAYKIAKEGYKVAILDKRRKLEFLYNVLVLLVKN